MTFIGSFAWAALLGLSYDLSSHFGRTGVSRDSEERISVVFTLDNRNGISSGSFYSNHLRSEKYTRYMIYLYFVAWMKQRYNEPLHVLS